MILKKKYILILLGAFFFFTPVFSQSSGNVRVWVMPTESKGLELSERWLPDEVHKVLRANITNYSGLSVVEENADMLAQIQAKSYNANISTADQIRMGEQIGANYVVLSTINKTYNSYSLNVVFQNLKSGEHLAESNKTAKNTETLYQLPGCAVNEATIEICDSLNSRFGTGLSSYVKRVLRNGTNDLSDEEERKFLEDEEKRYNNSILNLTKEISSMSLSVEADAAMQKTRLELAKHQEEEKLRQTQLRQQRMLQEAENRAAELRLQDKRKDETAKRINSAIKTLHDKVDELRNLKIEASNVVAQIHVIEAKKKAVLELRSEKAYEAERIKSEMNFEIKNKTNEIMNAELRDAYIASDGKMLPQVREQRQKQAAKEEARIKKEYSETLDKMYANYEDAEKDLVKQIEEHKKQLNVIRKADNIINRDLRLDVNRFIAERQAWSATAVLEIDNTAFFSTNFDITYKKLTKKEPDILSDEYADEVDYYNSLFSTGEKPVTAVLEYDFKAAPDSLPSQYILHVKSIKLTDTNTGVLIQEIQVNKDTTFNMEPVYDIRKEEVIKTEKIKEANNQHKEIQKQKKKQEKAEKAEERKRKSDFYSDIGFSGITAGLSLSKDGAGFDFAISDAFSRHFYNFVEGGMLPVVPELKSYSKAGVAGFFDAGLGINGRIPYLVYPNFFAQAGIGIYGFALADNLEYLSGAARYTDVTYFLFKVNAGVEVPFFEKPKTSLIVYVSPFWAIEGGYGMKFTAGINFGRWEWYTIF